MEEETEEQRKINIQLEIADMARAMEVSLQDARIEREKREREEERDKMNDPLSYFSNSKIPIGAMKKALDVAKEETIELLVLEKRCQRWYKRAVFDYFKGIGMQIENKKEEEETKTVIVNHFTELKTAICQYSEGNVQSIFSQGGSTDDEKDVVDLVKDSD